MKSVADLFSLVMQHYKGDTVKTWTFFKSANLHLGMVSPVDMVLAGRINELRKFIETKLVIQG